MVSEAGWLACVGPCGKLEHAGTVTCMNAQAACVQLCLPPHPTAFTSCMWPPCAVLTKQTPQAKLRDHKYPGQDHGMGAAPGAQPSGRHDPDEPGLGLGATVPGTRRTKGAPHYTAMLKASGSPPKPGGQRKASDAAMVSEPRRFIGIPGAGRGGRRGEPPPPAACREGPRQGGGLQDGRQGSSPCATAPLPHCLCAHTLPAQQRRLTRRALICSAVRQGGPSCPCAQAGFRGNVVGCPLPCQPPDRRGTRCTMASSSHGQPASTSSRSRSLRPPCTLRVAAPAAPRST